MKYEIEGAQGAFTCSKLTIETLEQGNTYFTPCSSVSIVDFEQVNAHWEILKNRINMYYTCLKLKKFKKFSPLLIFEWWINKLSYLGFT